MNRIVIACAFLYMGVGPSGAVAAEPSQGETTSYPTAGVAFVEPVGWHKQEREQGKTVGWWTSPDSKPGKPTAMIMIECATPAARSLEEVAQGLARNFQGMVDDRPTTLGGSRALRVTAKNDGRSLRPVEALATIHEGRLYLVMGGVTAGHSVKEEVESIRTSWTWTEVEPPFKHLTFRDRPLSLAKGAVTINVPSLMHVYANKEPDRVLDLALYNVVRNAPDFLVYAQIVPTAHEVSFDAYKSLLSDGLQAKQMIRKPLEWRTLSDTPPRVVSDTVEVEMAVKAGGPKHTSYLRWALVKLDDHRVVSVNFTLPKDAPGDQSTYIKLTDRIVDSIRIVTPAGEAEPKSGN